MKGIQRIIGVTSTILFIQTSFASTGALFQVTETGSPGTVSISLCLNGKGALSCQNYTISKLNLSILTTINHNYPAAGIKINTPGYTIDNIGIVCTPISNGYCLFSASHSLAKLFTLNGPSPTPTIQPAIASGYYFNGTAKRPLVATSNNSGTTWGYTVNGTTPTLPIDIDGDAILDGGASCSTLNCIAAGYYSNNSGHSPLVATSNNGGMTWTYTLDSTTPTLPNDLNGNALLTNASCSGSDCIAAGYYFNGTNNRPLVASSSDGGVTWAYTINEISPALPTDIDGEARLDKGASVSNRSYLSNSLLFLSKELEKDRIFHK